MSDSISNHSGPGSAAEPSMDEILASIRRILKEEDGSLRAAPDPEEDVLVLNADMIAPPADISSATELPADTGLLSQNEAGGHAFHEVRHFASTPEIDVAGEDAAAEAGAFEAAAPMPEPSSQEPPPAFEPPPQPPHPEPDRGAAPETFPMDEHQLHTPEGLIGQRATNEISNTIGAMVRSVTQERAVAVSRMGTTIEDIVREELRPVLKSWLDTHLPSLVERIVRAEIERVIDRSQL